MKRTERHHLKENELARTVAYVRERGTRLRGPIVTGAAVVAVVLVGFLGFALWQQRVEAKAQAMLAEALAITDAPVVPPASATTGPPPAPSPGTYASEQAKLEAALPKFLATADAYPTRRTGIAARFHAAAALAALNRFPEAEKQYQQVIDKQRNGIYGRMARLGLAEVQQRTGRHDAAVATYKELLNERSEEQLPADAILLHLAQAYIKAGKTAEARDALTRITTEFPDSSYAADAKRELDTLKPVGS